MLVEFSLHVDDVDPGHINHIQAENMARTTRQSDIQIDVQLLHALVHINQDLTLFLNRGKVIDLRQKQGCHHAENEKGSYIYAEWGWLPVAPWTVGSARSRGRSL